MVTLYVVKVPDYLKGEDTTEILTDAAPSFGDEIKAEHITGYTDKDITFGGRPVHLAECEWFAPAASFGGRSTAAQQAESLSCLTPTRSG
jgi:hypothetical protein